MKSVHSVCCNKMETFAWTVVLQAKKKLKRQNNNNKLLESAITIDALHFCKEVKRFKRVQRQFVLFLTFVEK